ncbi:MAG: MBL fold metallo-hydrolase [Halieaceae bacterium]|jgi:glyoxylase-like metal-dependent hydrolase (beta-lactamase superfamily II)|nr:MBL fold metallo-hydrolase [Halieaceae bacterium]
MRLMSISTLLFAALFPFSANAETPEDKYPESLLYDKPVKVAEGVYSAIGKLGYYSYENAGHNNNLSFVIGEEAVLVINGGTSNRLAAALHDEIKKLTDLPVKYVVDENGQTHAAAGNGYWQALGATVIAHVDAVEEIDAHVANGIARLQDTLKEQLAGTEVVPVDQTFDDEMVLDLGGVTARLMYLGPAHSPGDITVLIPERDVVIAGDIAFHERMLPVFPDTDTKAWLETWREVFTPLAKDRVIVPGHGSPTDFAAVDEFTRGYLEYLRAEVAKILDAGGSLADAYEIDQSQYMHLEAADQLAGKNAGRVFEAMEWE